MTYTDAEHRTRIHKHCLWLAERDRAYAQWAAKFYEDGNPVLSGLAERIGRDVQQMQIENHARPIQN